MALTTTSQIAGPVNYVFQQVLLRNAKARCPHFIGSTPGELMAHSNSFSVRWKRIENLTPTTSALSELTGTLSDTFPPRAGTQQSENTIEATVSKYGDFSFITEEVDLVNNNAHGAKFAELFGIQAGRSLNRLQRNILEDNASAIYASQASAAANVADPINADLIREAVNKLERSIADTFTPMSTGSGNFATSPISASYWGICHSDVKQDIMRLAGFQPVQSYAGQVAVESGEFGWLGDVRWVSSPECTIDANTGATPGNTVRSTSGTATDIYTSIVLGRDAHGSVGLDTSLIQEVYKAGDEIPGVMMISKPRGSSGVSDPLNEIGSVGWKAWHAGTMFESTGSSDSDSDWARAIVTGASVLTN